MTHKLTLNQVFWIASILPLDFHALICSFKYVLLKISFSQVCLKEHWNLLYIERKKKKKRLFLFHLKKYHQTFKNQVHIRKLTKDFNMFWILNPMHPKWCTSPTITFYFDSYIQKVIFIYLWFCHRSCNPHQTYRFKNLVWTAWYPWTKTLS